MADWRAEEAVNETIFRDLNEWTMQDNSGRLGPDRVPDVYLCECGDRGCSAPITLTQAEYELVRSESTRFAVAVDHENPEYERLLSEHMEYAVVEKFFGEPARIARASDPRRRASRAADPTDDPTHPDGPGGT